MRKEVIGNATLYLGDCEDWDVDECARCHGEGWIYESEGDQSDWQEDTYCGSDDSVIACRFCGGSGVLK